MASRNKTEIFAILLFVIIAALSSNFVADAMFIVFSCLKAEKGLAVGRPRQYISDCRPSIHRLPENEKLIASLSLSALLHFYLQPKVRDVHAKQHEIYIHIHTSPITMHTLRVSKSKVPMQSFVKYLYANSGAITFSISVSLYYSPMCAYN